MVALFDFSIIFLYFSKQAVFDGKKAIRGGIPFVFRKYARQNGINNCSEIDKRKVIRKNIEWRTEESLTVDLARNMVKRKYNFHIF